MPVLARHTSVLVYIHVGYCQSCCYQPNIPLLVGVMIKGVLPLYACTTQRPSQETLMEYCPSCCNQPNILLLAGGVLYLVVPSILVTFNRHTVYVWMLPLTLFAGPHPLPINAMLRTLPLHTYQEECISHSPVWNVVYNVVLNNNNNNNNNN